MTERFSFIYSSLQFEGYILITTVVRITLYHVILVQNTLARGLFTEIFRQFHPRASSLNLAHMRDLSKRARGKPILSGACLTREEDDEQERAKASGLGYFVAEQDQLTLNLTTLSRNGLI